MPDSTGDALANLTPAFFDALGTAGRGLGEARVLLNNKRRASYAGLREAVTEAMRSVGVTVKTHGARKDAQAAMGAARKGIPDTHKRPAAAHPARRPHPGQVLHYAAELG